MAERRRLERFDLTAPARVLVESKDRKDAALHLVTKDVSSDGAYLFCPRPIVEGARVKMELLISPDKVSKLVGESSSARIRVRGTVVRVDGAGVAIRFESKYKITALESSVAGAGPL